VYFRINCSAVLLKSMFFEETKLSINTSSFNSRTVHPDKGVKLACSIPVNIICATQQSQQTRGLFAGANIDVITVQSLLLPCSRESERLLKTTPTFYTVFRWRRFATISMEHEENF